MGHLRVDNLQSTLTKALPSTGDVFIAVMIEGKHHALCTGLAVSRLFPLYNRKTGAKAPESRNVYVDFILQMDEDIDYQEIQHLSLPQVGHGCTEVNKNEDVFQKEKICKRKCLDCDHWHDCSSRSLVSNCSPSRLSHHKNVHVDCNSNNPPPSMPSALGTENPLQHNTLYLTNAFSTKSSLGLSHPPLSFYENVHLNCNSSKLPSLTRPTFKEKQPLQNRDSLYFTDTTSSNSSIGVSTSSTVSMSLPLSFTSSLPDSDATSRSKLHNLQNIEYASHQRQFLNYRSTNVTAIHQISTDPSSQESFYTSSYPSNIPHSNSGCAPPNSVFPIHNSSFTPSSLPFSEYIPAYQSYSMFPSTDSPCCCCSYPSNVPYTDNQWTQRHLAFPAYNSTSPYPSFPCTSIPSSEYIPPCQTCTNDLSAWKSCCYSSYPSNVSYTNDQWAQYYPTFPIYSSTLPHSSFAEKLMASSEYIPHCQSYSTYPSACNSCCHPPNTLSVPYSNLVWAPANPTFPIYNSTSTHSSIPSSEYIAPCQSYSTFPSACNSCCYSSNTSTMPYSNSVWTPSNPAFPIYNSASSQSPFTSSSIPSSEYKNPQWTQSNPICNSSSLQFSSSTDPQYSSTPYYFPEVHPSHQSLSDNSRPSDTSFLNSRSNSQPYSSSNSSTTYPYFIPPKNTATLPECYP
ncbi:hypothetical protein HMI55_002883 [Coelomomyces lativittatus]|nr:hypothetical protein HMI55_002883 [Coelomomyces lativittatus]